MRFSPGLRRAVLAVHVTASVGWIGAVAAYLIMDLATAISSDAELVRASYRSMGLLTAWGLVPLAWGALATGILLGAGTRWGLLRHYWVVISLILTALAVTILMIETRTIYALAEAAAGARASEVSALPSTLPHSIGGLIVLLVINALNIYKPRGLTPYGWRRQAADEHDAAGS